MKNLQISLAMSAPMVVISWALVLDTIWHLKLDIIDLFVQPCLFHVHGSIKCQCSCMYSLLFVVA